MSEVPKWRVPFQWGATGAMTVEQDSTEEILNCVEAIVRTPKGSREENPEFGIPDAAFTRAGVNRTAIENIINTDEPRTTAVVSESVNALDNLIDNVTVRVTEGGA